MSRPVPLHREVHPDLDRPDCWGCKMCGVQFGLSRLRAENQGGYTQAALAKEIFTEARAKKKDIQQVRGRRRPHEVMRSEGWVKT